eukprot:5913048-Prymnesium_polylepis.2
MSGTASATRGRPKNATPRTTSSRLRAAPHSEPILDARSSSRSHQSKALRRGREPKAAEKRRQASRPVSLKVAIMNAKSNGSRSGSTSASSMAMACVVWCWRPIALSDRSEHLTDTYLPPHVAMAYDAPGGGVGRYARPA